MMRPLSAALLAGLVAASPARPRPSPLTVDYTLRIDSANLGGWSVEMRMRHAPDSFQLAMARHPEYDDRYWRYVRDVEVRGARGTPRIVRADSVVWTVLASGGSDVTVRYRLELPPAAAGPRGAWRPFLTPTGGLTGGPHAFMYLLGHTNVPSRVTFELPAGWTVATALRPTSDPRVFLAPDVHALVESPALVGRLHDWRFVEQEVPHRVVYWAQPSAPAFDTAAFVDGLRRLTHEALSLFRRAPYADYTFLYQDAAYGGLEHPASVTLGAPAATLAANPLGTMEESAHEFLHTWNLMRIRPIEYTGVSHRAPAPSSGLWFSEGLTMYYADALLRRAGIATNQPTREGHLASRIEGYLNTPGESRFSAEAVSRVAYNAGPGALGDYDASVHRQGELIGTMLDFIVREATGGARTMDDVMRLMLERFSTRGFSGQDVERATEDVCSCDVTPLFDAHVRGAGAIDFARHLRRIGFDLQVARVPAERDGVALPDLRVYAWQPEGETGVRLWVSRPDGAWARAGLHSGDRLVSMNGASPASWTEFRGILSRVRIGDTVHVAVMRASGPFETRVPVTGYERTTVRIVPLNGATPAQAALRERWRRGW